MCGIAGLFDTRGKRDFDRALVQRMGEIGEACGLQWAGRWRGALRESVHFQLDRGAS